MGPAAWRSIGKALGLTLIRPLFGGKYSVIAVIAREIHRAIIRGDIEIAKAMLIDMAYKHKNHLEYFIKHYSKNLSSEAINELKEILNSK